MKAELLKSNTVHLFSTLAIFLKYCESSHVGLLSNQNSVDLVIHEFKTNVIS